MKQAKTPAMKHKTRLVCIPDAEHDKGKEIGGGNFSKGVRIAINRYIPEIKDISSNSANNTQKPLDDITI